VETHRLRHVHLARLREDTNTRSLANGAG
jgi:hypothetical protein